jgi:hypothetical protein
MALEQEDKGMAEAPPPSKVAANAGQDIRRFLVAASDSLAAGGTSGRTPRGEMTERPTGSRTTLATLV